MAAPMMNAVRLGGEKSFVVVVAVACLGREVKALANYHSMDATKAEKSAEKQFWIF